MARATWPTSHRVAATVPVAPCTHHVLLLRRVRKERPDFFCGGSGRDALEGGGGGLGVGLKGGGGVAGSPLLPGSPYGPRQRQAKTFYA